MKNLYYFILLTFCLIQTTKLLVQKVNVKGQVICEKRSVRNVLIELREHDLCNKK